MRKPSQNYLLYKHKWINPYVRLLLGGLSVLAFLASVLLILSEVYKHGFVLSAADLALVGHVQHGVWLVFLLNIMAGLLLQYENTRRKYNRFSWLVIALFLLTLVPTIFYRPAEGLALAFWDFVASPSYKLVMLLVLSIQTLSNVFMRLLDRRVNPSLILAFSFAAIILTGTGLLLLPRSTIDGISWLDALFLSTSAVCVTGMSPLDIAETLTPTGSAVLLLLIQVGGLGVLTFTSFFAMFFMGNTSMYSQMMVRDMVSSKSINSLLSTLGYILAFTIVIESVGAAFIWTDIHGTLGMSYRDEVFFSVFHAISAFCNAGFSNLPGGLGNELILTSHIPFFLYLAVLILLGGLGFPILVNFKDVIVFNMQRLWAALRHRHVPIVGRHNLYNINTRIVLVMTLVLFVGAMGAFVLTEWHGVLNGLSVPEKFTHALFLAVCPRSAGFTCFSPVLWGGTTVILYAFLMWVGGAAQSTAGGIKVNAFAVVALNLVSLLRGSANVEIFGREISRSSIARSYATMMLSLLSVFVAMLAMNVIEPQLSLREVFFECLGALTTAGISMDATSSLHDGGKLLMVPLMFIGRLGMLTIMMGLVKPKKNVNYRYPSGEIIIN